MQAAVKDLSALLFAWPELSAWQICLLPGKTTPYHSNNSMSKNKPAIRVREYFPTKTKKTV